MSTPESITVWVTADGCIVPEGTPGASPVTVTAPAEGSIKVGLVNAKQPSQSPKPKRPKPKPERCPYCGVWPGDVHRCSP